MAGNVLASRNQEDGDMRAIRTIALAAALVAALVSVARAAPSAAQKCESAKDGAEGKFARCRLKADSRYAKTLNAAKRAAAYMKCETNLARAYTKAEAKYPGSCPTTGDESSVEAFLQACTDKASSWTAGSLASTLVFERFAASGQTTCWLGGNDSTNPTPAACAGTGQDGQHTAGATLAYVDNGDGTITDSNSGLMWEKKSDDGSLHDKDTFYPWVSTCTGDGTTWCTRDNDCTVPGGACSGTTIFEWVDQVNAASFAMHDDWRVPNVRELASLVNYEHSYPAPPVSVEFNNGCGVDSSGNPGCTVTTCSCTVPTGYWSSSTVGGIPQNAYVVSFIYGAVGYGGKTNSVDSVRAVRGGS
jgi:hypothetical protein